MFPDKLNIDLVERIPSVIISDNNYYYLVNEEGIILSQTDQFYNENELYILTGLNMSSKKLGEIIKSREFNESKNIIYALENIFPDQFYKIKVISTNEFILFHKEKQIEVRIKDGNQLINEWYLLESALQKVLQEELQLEEINMIYEDRCSIILKENGL